MCPDPAGQLGSRKLDVVSAGADQTSQFDQIIQVLVHGRDQDTFSAFVQQDAPVRFYSEVFREDHQLHAQVDDNILRPDAEGLDQILGEYRPVVFVPVQDADERIQAGLQQGPLRFSIQHAQRVVQQ